MANVRIQKILSEAGIASRRAVELMIGEGRITVNGQLITALPCFVEPGDEILVDGRPVRKRPQRKVYILLNKPRGVVCTAKDEPGFNRPCAVDLVPSVGERVYCVGRLEEESTGLIILTNDGELTNRLTHPRYGVSKTYVAKVEGKVLGDDLATMRRGMFIDGRRTGGANVRIIRASVNESLLELRIAETRNRQLRRMLEKLGHKVRRLHRSAIGPVRDSGLKIGRFRYLDADEVAALDRAAGGGEGHGQADDFALAHGQGEGPDMRDDADAGDAAVDSAIASLMEHSHPKRPPGRGGQKKPRFPKAPKANAPAGDTGAKRGPHPKKPYTPGAKRTSHPKKPYAQGAGPKPTYGQGAGKARRPKPTYTPGAGKERRSRPAYGAGAQRDTRPKRPNGPPPPRRRGR